MKPRTTMVTLPVVSVCAMLLTACVSSQMPMSPATDDVDSAPPPPTVEASGPREEAGGECHLAAIQYAIGESFDDASRAELQRESNARHIRVLHPGDAATMDHRPDRLNIHLNDQDIIEELRCG